MEKLKTPPEYWRAAEEQIDRQLHHCYRCHRVNGEVVNVKRNALAHGSDASVRRITVRLVDVGGTPRLACTKCIPWPPEPKEDRELINKLTPSLFDGPVESPTKKTGKANQRPTKAATVKVNLSGGAWLHAEGMNEPVFIPAESAEEYRREHAALKAIGKQPDFWISDPIC